MAAGYWRLGFLSEEVADTKLLSIDCWISSFFLASVLRRPPSLLALELQISYNSVWYNNPLPVCQINQQRTFLGISLSYRAWTMVQELPKYGELV